MMEDSNTVTIKESYEAIFYFIERFYKMSKSDALGEILSGMEYLEDGRSAELLLWDYWLESIKVAKRSKGLPQKVLH